MKNGFTLIEIMVAISIFAIVATVATGALVTASDVNRKAQAIKLATDNVNFAMDSMILNLRDGTKYDCLPNAGALAPVHFSNVGTLNSCTGGGEGIVFLSRRGSNSGGPDRYIVYRFNKDPITNLGRIQIAYSDSPTYTDITSPEVDIKSASFYVPSPGSSTETPPRVERVVIVVSARVPGKTDTNFFLQTSVKSNF
ncbi:MAG: type II secretion system protein [Patescibacteria group bacterium]